MGLEIMVEEFKPKVRRAQSEALDDKVLRAESLLKARRYEDALDVLNEIIAADPENGGIYAYAAQALIGLKQYESAVEYAHEAVRLDPMNVTASAIAGEVQLRLQNWEEALVHFQHVIHLDSNCSSAYFGVGRVFHERQQYDEAIEIFRQALTLDAKYRKAYAGLAKAYLAKKDKEEGVIDIRNDNVRDLLNRLGNLSILEEDELNDLSTRVDHEELEERIADIQYITAWLEFFLAEFRWHSQYLKRALQSSGHYIIPQGMEEGFEDFL